MESLFFKLPTFLQNIIISFYNVFLYRIRNGGNYKQYKKSINSNSNFTLEQLKTLQFETLKKFLTYSKSKSKYYNKLYKNIDLNEIKKITDLNKFPILSKETLRTHIKDIYTIEKKHGVISKTGGTTGKPLEVIYTKDDMQMRYAFLDNFRASYGYKLGIKTAWFSGKKILNNQDLKKNRFWKTDYINKVRYYSTFHVDDKYLKYYLEDLIKYRPQFFVGFPSTILEIAKYGIRNNIDFPKNIVKAIFPTAETVTQEIREILKSYFHTSVVDQYASSEGAPFILECSHNQLHLELQSGVFEILDDNNNPTNEGRLVLTSFTTHGTPLIRYDIGDRLKLSQKKSCPCGNNNPLVDKIMGRINDYIYSLEVGKINLGNISNTLKGVHGIQKFQVIQNSLDELIIKIIIDENQFIEKYKSKFIQNWRDRVGQKMKIILCEVSSIPNEKSGKFRIVKNNIKHLINRIPRGEPRV